MNKSLKIFILSWYAALGISGLFLILALIYFNQFEIIKLIFLINLVFIIFLSTVMFLVIGKKAMVSLINNLDLMDFIILVFLTYGCLTLGLLLSITDNLLSLIVLLPIFSVSFIISLAIILFKNRKRRVSI